MQRIQEGRANPLALRSTPHGYGYLRCIGIDVPLTVIGLGEESIERPGDDFAASVGQHAGIARPPPATVIPDQLWMVDDRLQGRKLG